MEELIKTEYKAELPELFKEASSGRTQKWKSYVEAYDKNDKLIPIDNSKIAYAIIRTTYGAEGGKMQDAEVIIDKGKNIGRSNETTIIQQAILELISKWNHQKSKRGYTENVKEIKKIKIKPMLAHKYPDSSNYLDFKDTWVQEKYDGIRALAIKESDGEFKLISRNEEPFKGLNAIKHELKTLDIPKDIIIDGELYSRELTFNDIVSLCKTKTKIIDDSKINYFVFDLINLNDPNMGFTDRYKLLHKLIKKGTNHIKLVPTYQVHSPAEIDKFFHKMVKQKAEGIIIRAGKGIYKINGRSHYLLKYKPKQDAEFKIIDVQQGVGKNKGLATMVLITKEGKEFKAAPSMTDAEKREIYKNKEKYIGKFGTVEFAEYTKDGVPRFPIFKAVRKGY